MNEAISWFDGIAPKKELEQGIDLLQFFLVKCPMLDSTSQNVRYYYLSRK